MRVSSSMFSDQLTIVHPGTGDDGFGNPAPDWATATRATARGRISQRARSELNNGGRAAQTSEWEAYFPPGTEIDGSCRVEQGSAVFEVIGPPYKPTTSAGINHVTARLSLVEG